jgi:hypothetical protein
MSSNFELIGRITSPAGADNDDRVGTSSDLVWAVDGATDVVAERLLPGPSDAAWLAEAFDRQLRAAGAMNSPTLHELLASATERIAQEFQSLSTRAPRGRGEHPSAAGVVVRARAGAFDYWSVSDCQLIVAPPTGQPFALGPNPEAEAGDRALAQRLRELRASSSFGTWRTARDELLPGIRQVRTLMNRPDGYGVLSLTMPPEAFIRQGQAVAPPGTLVLLATDGFTRLADVFHRYPAVDLARAAATNGLSSLLGELRTLESADADCVGYPRTKPHDDASAILIRFIA